MSSDTTVRLAIDGETSPERADETLRGLLDALREDRRLDARVDESGVAGAGSKAIGLGVGEILVAWGAANALFPALIGLVKDWLLRQPPTTKIRIKDGDQEFEWSGSTPPAAVEAMIAAHAARTAD